MRADIVQRDNAAHAHRRLGRRLGLRRDFRLRLAWRARGVAHLDRADRVAVKRATEAHDKAARLDAFADVDGNPFRIEPRAIGRQRRDQCAADLRRRRRDRQACGLVDRAVDGHPEVESLGPSVSARHLDRVGRAGGDAAVLQCRDRRGQRVRQRGRLQCVDVGLGVAAVEADPVGAVVLGRHREGVGTEGRLQGGLDERGLVLGGGRGPPVGRGPGVEQQRGRLVDASSADLRLILGAGPLGEADVEIPADPGSRIETDRDIALADPGRQCGIDAARVDRRVATEAQLGRAVPEAEAVFLADIATAMLKIQDLVFVGGRPDLEHRDGRRGLALSERQREFQRLRWRRHQGGGNDDALQQRQVTAGQGAAERHDQRTGLRGHLGRSRRAQCLVQRGLDRRCAGAEGDLAREQALAVDIQQELIAALGRRGEAQALLLGRRVTGQHDPFVSEARAAGLGTAQIEPEAGLRNDLALQGAAEAHPEAHALPGQGRVPGHDDVTWLDRDAIDPAVKQFRVRRLQLCDRAIVVPTREEADHAVGRVAAQPDLELLGDEPGLEGDLDAGHRSARPLNRFGDGEPVTRVRRLPERRRDNPSQVEDLHFGAGVLANPRLHGLGPDARVFGRIDRGFGAVASGGRVFTVGTGRGVFTIGTGCGVFARASRRGVVARPARSGVLSCATSRRVLCVTARRGVLALALALAIRLRQVQGRDRQFDAETRQDGFCEPESRLGERGVLLQPRRRDVAEFDFRDPDRDEVLFRRPIRIGLRQTIGIQPVVDEVTQQAGDRLRQHIEDAEADVAVFGRLGLDVLEEVEIEFLRQQLQPIDDGHLGAELQAQQAETHGRVVKAELGGQDLQDFENAVHPGDRRPDRSELHRGQHELDRIGVLVADQEGLEALVQIGRQQLLERELDECLVDVGDCQRQIDVDAEELADQLRVGQREGRRQDLQRRCDPALDRVRAGQVDEGLVARTLVGLEAVERLFALPFEVERKRRVQIEVDQLALELGRVNLVRHEICVVLRGLDLDRAEVEQQLAAQQGQLETGRVEGEGGRQEGLDVGRADPFGQVDVKLERELGHRDLEGAEPELEGVDQIEQPGVCPADRRADTPAHLTGLACVDGAEFLQVLDIGQCRVGHDQLDRDLRAERDRQHSLAGLVRPGDLEARGLQFHAGGLRGEGVVAFDQRTLDGGGLVGWLLGQHLDQAHALPADRHPQIDLPVLGRQRDIFLPDLGIVERDQREIDPLGLRAQEAVDPSRGAARLVVGGHLDQHLGLDPLAAVGALEVGCRIREPELVLGPGQTDAVVLGLHDADRAQDVECALGVRVEAPEVDRIGLDLGRVRVLVDERLEIKVDALGQQLLEPDHEGLFVAVGRAHFLRQEGTDGQRVLDVSPEQCPHDAQIAQDEARGQHLDQAGQHGSDRIVLVRVRVEHVELDLLTGGLVRIETAHMTARIELGHPRDDSVEIDCRQAELAGVQIVIDQVCIGLRGVDRDRLAEVQQQLLPQQRELERRQRDLEGGGQEGLAGAVVGIDREFQFGQHELQLTLRPGLGIDEIEQGEVIPADRDLETPVGHRPVPPGGLVCERRDAVLRLRQFRVRQQQLEVDLRTLDGLAEHVVARRLDRHAGFERRRRALGRRLHEHLEQRLALPADACTQADIPGLPRQIDAGQHQVLLEVRQIRVVDVDRDRVVPVVLGPVLHALGAQQRVEVDRVHLDDHRVAIGVDEVGKRLGRVDLDRPAVHDLDGLAEQRDLQRRDAQHELGRQDLQRVDLDIAEEDRGTELGQDRIEAPLQQRRQIDHLQQRGVGPADGRSYAPVERLSAVGDRAEHQIVLVIGHLRVGQPEVQRQLGTDPVEQRAHAQGKAGVGGVETRRGGLGALAVEEVLDRQAGPAPADRKADVVFVVADRNGGKDDLLFLVGHLRFEKAQHVAGVSLRRQQFVPVAGVAVIGLGQIDRRRLAAQVSVDAPRRAAGLVVLGHQHLLAEVDLLLAVGTVEVDRKVLAVAFAGVTPGRCTDDGGGRIDRRCVGRVDRDGAADQQLCLRAFGHQDVGVGAGTDLVGRHDHARGRTAFGAGLVARGRVDGGRHRGADRQVAADVEMGVLDLGQHVGRLLGADVAAQQGVDRLAEDVLRLPAQGVEGQRHAHRRAARGDRRRVLGQDLGLVLGVDGQAAAGVEIGLGQRGLGARQHHVVGDQAVDRDRRAGPAGQGLAALAFRRAGIGGIWCFGGIRSIGGGVRAGTIGRRGVGLRLGGLLLGQGLRHATDRGDETGDLQSLDRDVATRLQRRTVQTGANPGSQVVVDSQPADGHAAATGGRQARIGADDGAVARQHRHVAAGRQRQRLGRVVACRQRGRSVDRRADPGQAVGGQAVGGQHEAGAAGSRAGGGLVAQRGADVSPVARVRVVLFQRAGLHAQVRAHARVARHQTGTNQGWRHFGAGAGAQQRVDRVGEDVLRCPADGVEGEHHPHGGAVGGHGRGVRSLDRRDVVGEHLECALDDQHAAGDHGVGPAEHEVVGDQAVHRQAHRRCWRLLRRVRALAGLIGALLGACVRVRRRFGPVFGRRFGVFVRALVCSALVTGRAFVGCGVVGRGFFRRGFLGSGRRGLAGQCGRDARRLQRQHQHVLDDRGLDPIDPRIDLAAHIVAHHQTTDGGATAAAGHHLGLGLDLRLVLGGHRQRAAGADRHLRIALVTRIDLGECPGADHVAGQHQTHTRTGARGRRLVEDLGAHTLARARIDREGTAGLQRAGQHAGDDERRVFVADARTQQRVQGVEQDVLRCPADGVESQRRPDRRARGSGGGGILGLDRGAIARLDRQVAPGHDAAVEHGVAHLGLHRVRGDQTVQRERGILGLGLLLRLRLRRLVYGRLVFGAPVCGILGSIALWRLILRWFRIQVLQRFVGQQRGDRRGTPRIDRDVALDRDRGAIDEGVDHTAHIVAHELAACRRRAAARGRAADAGRDARGVTGPRAEAAAHHDSVGRAGTQRSQHQRRAGTRQIARQHEAHRGPATRADRVDDGRRDLRHRHGRGVQVAGDIDLDILDADRHHGRHLGADRVGAQEGVECRGEDVLRRPANRVEGQHRAHGRATALGDRGVGGRDRRFVAGGDRQTAVLGHDRRVQQQGLGP